ncbi:GNAT family N-acetyltransferase [Mucilaginibacter sp. BJC16-A38]|uniref:GNAT family N-acetyltransferase n=1 Tax=Mucilaginibacter phenanthrenivorans TaxID=1234842 RepID=UPI0021572EC5|nr:GNAT family N-acetyltransferase [Mucilaginibacter phenanthrenivorans]MCR8556683.1 GNAT family N-acetyltransferase [Mucilaginibacter phenanthrenivorans]
MSSANITIVKAEITDAAVLLEFSKATFFHFFGPLNDPANMEAYASVAFTSQKMLSELINPDSEFYFAMIGDEIAGYLKLNFSNAQTEFREADAMEIERIYVSQDHQRKKVGQQLLDFAIETATNKKFKYVWLGVWENNHNALAFYKHNDFEVFSSHEFVLGDDLQTDLLMKRLLN